MDPHFAGMLDALNGDGIPANQRPVIPFEGLDRLRFWQGRKRTGDTLLLGGDDRSAAGVSSKNEPEKEREWHIH